MSISTEAERFKADIDEALEDGEFDDSTVESLSQTLEASIDGGVSVVVLIYLVEHPVMEQALKDDDVPKGLVGTMSKTLHASLDMFSEWTGAPILVQLKRLSREYRREKETFEAVMRRLEEADEQTALTIMERYLDNEPSAYFSEQLAEKYPDFVAQLDKSG